MGSNPTPLIIFALMCKNFIGFNKKCWSKKMTMQAKIASYTRLELIFDSFREINNRRGQIV